MHELLKLLKDNDSHSHSDDDDDDDENGEGGGEGESSLNPYLDSLGSWQPTLPAAWDAEHLDLLHGLPPEGKRSSSSAPRSRARDSDAVSWRRPHAQWAKQTCGVDTQEDRDGHGARAVWLMASRACKCHRSVCNSCPQSLSRAASSLPRFLAQSI